MRNNNNHALSIRELILLEISKQHSSDLRKYLKEEAVPLRSTFSQFISNLFDKELRGLKGEAREFFELIQKIRVESSAAGRRSAPSYITGVSPAAPTVGHTLTREEASLLNKFLQTTTLQEGQIVNYDFIRNKVSGLIFPELGAEKAYIDLSDENKQIVDAILRGNPQEVLPLLNIPNVAAYPDKLKPQKLDRFTINQQANNAIDKFFNFLKNMGNKVKISAPPQEIQNAISHLQNLVSNGVIKTEEEFYRTLIRYIKYPSYDALPEYVKELIRYSEKDVAGEIESLTNEQKNAVFTSVIYLTREAKKLQIQIDEFFKLTQSFQKAREYLTEHTKNRMRSTFEYWWDNIFLPIPGAEGMTKEKWFYTIAGIASPFISPKIGELFDFINAFIFESENPEYSIATRAGIALVDTLSTIANVPKFLTKTYLLGYKLTHSPLEKWTEILNPFGESSASKEAIASGISARKAVNKLLSRGGEALETGKEKASQAIEKGQKAAEQSKEKVEKTVEKAVEKVQDIGTPPRRGGKRIGGQ